MCTTRPPPPSRHKSRHSPIQRTISYSERRVTVSGHLTGPVTQGVFMSHPARAAAAPVTDANAHFPSIRRTVQQARIAPPRHRYHRHMTIPQTGQKTGHRPLQQAVSYSEIPLRTSLLMKTAISPSRNPAHHFRRLFDDSHALFVLNSVHTFGYNGTYPNIRSCYDAFTNRSENRSEKRQGIRS